MLASGCPLILCLRQPICAVQRLLGLLTDKFLLTQHLSLLGALGLG